MLCVIKKNTQIMAHANQTGQKLRQTEKIISVDGEQP